MSTITTPAPTAVQQYVSPVPAKGVSFMRVLQSEWTKLRTLRSTWVGHGRRR
jgi:hypothetical protein